MTNPFAFLSLPPSEASLVLPAIQKINLRHIQRAAWIGPAVNLIHIVAFAWGFGTGTATEELWRLQIILSHSVLLVCFVAAALLAPFSRAVTHALYFVVLLAGVLIATVDQQVTTAVTPYLLVSLLVPGVLQLPPRSAIAYHTVSLVVFGFLMARVQTDPNVQLSTLVNGVAAWGGGTFLSVLLWNFTRTRLVQQHRIEEQTRQLTALNQTKDRFFSIIAHDLRSPLAGFTGLLDLLVDKENPTSEQERAEALELLHQSSVSLFGLLENLLVWSKSQQDLLEVRSEDLRILTVLEGVAKPWAGVTQERKLTVEVSCDPELVCHTDREILATVVRNLFSNASKFTPAGGKIVLSARKDAQAPGQVLFECRDSGVGMTQEAVRNLFQVGLRSGLGLVLCRDFVRLLGGELSVESAPGVGSRFWFRLPAAPTPC